MLTRRRLRENRHFLDEAKVERSRSPSPRNATFVIESSPPDDRRTIKIFKATQPGGGVGRGDIDAGTGDSDADEDESVLLAQRDRGPKNG